MTQALALFKKEFLGYFRTPVGYVFIVIFLLASVGLTFFLGGFYDSNQASLQVFFVFHPWLFLFLAPSVGMRLWAEERHSGTVELLLTLPFPTHHAVIAKFLAAWAFLGAALALTFPMVLTVNYLGEPDNGVILAGYLGSFLMAGAYLAVTSFTSALTRNQVISFILGVVVCFALVLVSWGVFSDLLSEFLPVPLVDFVAYLGFMTHFESISRGLIDTRDLIYFASVIVVMLSATVTVIESRKAR